MKDDAQRLVFLLAASGLNERALREALTELAILGSEDVVRRVQQIRRAYLGRALEFPFEEARPNTLGSDRQLEHLVGEITRLLQDEAHLSASAAAGRLADSLGSQEGRGELPRFRAKEGLSTWIRRVTKVVPSSELLHHATKIRNAVVHSAPIAWPLRERSE